MKPAIATDTISTLDQQTFLQVKQTVPAIKTSDGAGVRLLRSLGTHQLPSIDPFLMLDEFKSDQPDDYIAGFPSHPHRGFETVTYLLAGKLEHKDHKGNTGIIRSGGVQWMTAGRGIIHSETPIQENGLMWGFQLWVNLPSHQKMKPPAYQTIEPGQIPEVRLDNDTVIRVIAGTSFGVNGVVKGIDSDPLFLDIRLPEGTALEQPVEKFHNSFVYVYRGSIDVKDAIEGRKAAVAAGHLALLSKGDVLSVMATEADTGLLVLSGKPINEPIAKYGPFVMNTEAELQQAIRDYQAGKLAT